MIQVLQGREREGSNGVKGNGSLEWRAGLEGCGMIPRDIVTLRYTGLG